MSSVHTWKLSVDGSPIAQVLNFDSNIEQAKVVTKALDGTIYIQTIGKGVPYANIKILCSLEEKTLVNYAEADGAVLTVVYRDKKYTGYIESAPFWNAESPGEWYTATIKFLIEGGGVSV